MNDQRKLAEQAVASYQKQVDEKLAPVDNHIRELIRMIEQLPSQYHDDLVARIEHLATDHNSPSAWITTLCEYLSP